MKIIKIGNGTCEFAMASQEFRMQPFNVVHGGNMATLIDSACFWSCYFSLGDDQDGLTSVDLKLNYLAPAKRESLVCKGKLIKAGKFLSYAEAEIKTDQGKLIAHGTSTLMRLTGAGLKLPVPMFL